VDARAQSRAGSSTGEEILAAADDADADLVILGATVRRLDGRAFLGHNVEHVLAHARETVVVVTTPDITSAAEVPGSA
jgi:nucleotide-binding universal stress UspA family protein